ncbi:DinB family protein [Glaciecola sp. 1036]|uniref:DinB family protein n=1 Tax=Alteromonadaceae TaxID=72275 RepID=UPI003D034625
MSTKDHFQLMAQYNQWMNDKLYKVLDCLDEGTLIEDKGAFFGSILGTLNHILVADIIWLQRFSTHLSSRALLANVAALEAPRSLDQIYISDILSLAERRTWLDQQILHWISGIQENDLDSVIHYANTKGVESNKQLSFLIMHFFNHQTHHRGQLTTLLAQQNIDIGVTDLLAIIPQQDIS